MHNVLIKRLYILQIKKKAAVEVVAMHPGAVLEALDDLVIAWNYICQVKRHLLDLVMLRQLVRMLVFTYILG